MIRRVTKDDAEEIIKIYNYYILNTTITFEEEPVTIEEMKNRIVDYTKNNPWFIYEEDNKIIGYCYATKWRVRSAYRYSVEITVYLDHNYFSKGIGTALYTKLIDELKKSNTHAVVAGITLPNEKSQKLHEKMGFKKIAQFEEIGRKFNKWHDVGYWELKL